jgi:hypothetical protein
MAVCHVGETWVVQSLSMGSVYLASLVECIRHKRMLSPRHTAHRQEPRQCL